MFKIIFLVSCVIQWITSQEISKIVTTDVNIAKSPYLDEETQSIYFINYLTSGEEPSIFRYSFQDCAFYSATIIGITSPSFIIPVRRKCTVCKNLFIVGADNDILLINWNGKSANAQVIKTLFSLETNDPSKRINQGKVDSKGRLYVGTISKQFCGTNQTSAFYRYSPKTGVVKLFDGVYSTTDIAIDENAKKLYHLDVCTLILSDFDWDSATGDICNGRVAFDFRSIGKSPGSFVPVGMDVNTNGILYITDYADTKLYAVDPRSRSVVNIIEVNQKGFTGLTFGGFNRNILYLTDASSIVNVFTATIEDTSFSGSSLYTVTGLGTGQPARYFKLSCKMC